MGVVGSTTGAVVGTTSSRSAIAALLESAQDLCASAAAEDRYHRLLRSVRRIAPCDSAAFLQLTSDGALVPVASIGLAPEALAQRFHPMAHPRLALALATKEVVRFPPDSDLPDPFDGLILGHAGGETRVHACVAVSLRIEGQVVGVLAIDAIAEDAFDRVSDETFSIFAALLAAAVHTAALVDALQHAAVREGRVRAQLLQEVHQRAGPEFIGVSRAAGEIRNEVALLAASDLGALITGETGVGKEVAARAIHAQSARAERPMIHVNCAALPETIAEAELFGHTRGAFTGAESARPGKFEVADGGTLFLDEIGELPLSLQPKLLRVLQTGEVQRVGADEPIKVDVRVIAATNRDLSAEVAAGRFRADLFHRLSVYPLHLAPLREHPEDVPVLAGYFLDGARIRLGLGTVRLAPAAREALLRYPWPGNVRELEHVMLRAALRAAEGRRNTSILIGREHLSLGDEPHLPPRSEPPSPPLHVEPMRDAIEALQRRLIRVAVEEAHGNWAEAARKLGLDRGNLHRMAKRLGVLDSP
ncbi:MAG: nitric oxide reductase transcriptional regulator NorR [Deltaproteobacteria bacterium]|nr:nitric oxide reductase transcriptional regulator NorR [Deltaproteobacteria bacterium]